MEPLTAKHRRIIQELRDGNPEDTRADDQLSATIERFSDDPSEGLVAFNPDGTFEWPKGWDVERKVRAIDRARRGGNPCNEAVPLGQCHPRTLHMVKKLAEEIGLNEADARIQEVKAEIDEDLLSNREKTEK